MSDIIRADATCFIFFHSASDTRGRLWVAGTDTRFDRRGNRVLEPLLNVEPRNAVAWRYDLALIAVRRFGSEGLVPAGYKASITLQAADSALEVSSAESAPVFREDQRVPMHFRNLIAVPGFDVRDGREVWYCRFPGQGLESVRGSTPEEAVDRVYEMKLERFAEQYIPPPEPPPQAPATPRKNYGGHRIRPGDLR